MSEELKRVRDILRIWKVTIGDGSHPEDLSDVFLSNSPGSILTGQAYEDLHFVYYSLQRAIDSIEDVLAIGLGDELVEA